MRGFAFTLALVSMLAYVAPACAGFAGAYAPENWTFHSEGPAGNGLGTLTETQMYVQGLVDHLQGYVYYSITIQADATLSFDWSYVCDDVPLYDWGLYRVNGVDTVLSFTGGESGSAAVPVAAGDVFALGVWSQDGWFAPGQLTVANFVPEPTCLVLLGLGALVLRRR